jgi:hypothetical protein
MYKVAVISLMQCKKVLMKCDLFYETKEYSHDFKIVVVLQNCMHGFNINSQVEETLPLWETQAHVGG